MKRKENPKIEKLNNLKMHVFELNKTLVQPVHFITNYNQPQIGMLFFENHYCLKQQYYAIQ